MGSISLGTGNSQPPSDHPPLFSPGPNSPPPPTGQAQHLVSLEALRQHPVVDVPWENVEGREGELRLPSEADPFADRPGVGRVGEAELTPLGIFVRQLQLEQGVRRLVAGRAPEGTEGLCPSWGSLLPPRRAEGAGTGALPGLCSTRSWHTGARPPCRSSGGSRQGSRGSSGSCP